MEHNTQDNNQKKQKYLGDKGFVVFITFLSAFIPLSTDIYLPALPRMAEYFSTSASMINLTLTLFFIFYAIGTIFWGPLSDKYGRRAILIIGMSIYTISSLLCIFSTNVYQLILFRILQSIGCGAATAVATAIVKDVYSGQKRVTILALVQSMGMFSPIISPVIGAAILSILSWRGVFIVLAILGLATLVGSIAMEETIDERNTGSIIKSIGRLGVVAKNKSFMSLLVTFSIMSIPGMSYITASSFIYVNGFGVSEKVYSYYFAANAIFFMIGPLVYIKLAKHINSNLTITISYIVSGISGLLLCIIGNLSPWVFALVLMPASFFGSLVGPPRTNLMLEQLDGDTGAASSLMSCAFTIFGSIGMFMISLNFTDRILVMGLMYMIVSLIGLLLWINIYKKPYIKPVNTHEADEKVS
ncbi:MFS transporter, DHA1 family, bicyclomycin/chloramphenicol resistance protein [Clostridium cavendishii DSM 21758]|uniref:Bcr/CflA family efflux transporter n=1 Tax=Clostridium cavendishii DSM 21758 TaxID=1121302 RepID=A0A1M6SJJ9_9CLOT|nr:multidrug effflux MFS transporter [Clostridium cavendishii]SHK44826.1 MFS transporter, DHA1 family, bicyclomycin/chloramphenicol resistance protein [Clostridium cavendishii DSM 21758]